MVLKWKIPIPLLLWKLIIIFPFKPANTQGPWRLMPYGIYIPSLSIPCSETVTVTPLSNYKLTIPAKSLVLKAILGKFNAQERKF